MINKVSIRNFKCLREVQIELERFSVFVGPNGSGKSSILQGLDLLCRSFRDQQANVEAEFLQAASRDANGYVELAAEYGGKGYRYRSHSSSSTSQPVLPGQAVRGPSQTWSGEGRGIASE